MQSSSCWQPGAISQNWLAETPGSHFNIKIVLSRYRDYHYIRPSYHCNGNSYSGSVLIFETPPNGHFWNPMKIFVLSINHKRLGQQPAKYESNPISHKINCNGYIHYGDIIMGAMASEITSITLVYSTVYSVADRRKHQSSALLAFVWGIHRGPVNSTHKGPVTRKMFPFDDVIMPNKKSVLLILFLHEMNL